ncbi:MAG: hypothetical protein C0418_06385, partial [Coriobacteriaceae bacterium]|nr:hypothetical protein [Coriobacteriaceae bacterium]
MLASAVMTTLLATAVPAQPASAERADTSAHRGNGEVVVLVKDAEALVVTLEAAGIRAEDVRDLGHGLAQIEPPDGVSADELARRLSQVPGVRAAAPGGRVRALTAMVPPDDPLYPSQRTYLGPASDPTPHAIGLEPAWDRAFNGTAYAMNTHRAGVKIAVIDTGVSMPFAETTGEFVPVWDYANNDADPSDDNGHGTMVASVLRAKTANGTGIAGVLHSSANQILVYKVLDAYGSGGTTETLVAIMDAADKGAKVINCSL